MKRIRVRRHKRRNKKTKKIFVVRQHYRHLKQPKKIDHLVIGLDEERSCWQCTDRLDFEDFKKTNITFKLEELKRIWQDCRIQLYCCDCFNNKVVEAIVKEKRIENQIEKLSPYFFDTPEQIKTYLSEDDIKHILYLLQEEYIELIDLGRINFKQDIPVSLNEDWVLYKDKKDLAEQIKEDIDIDKLLNLENYDEYIDNNRLSAALIKKVFEYIDKYYSLTGYPFEFDEEEIKIAASLVPMSPIGESENIKTYEEAEKYVKEKILEKEKERERNRIRRDPFSATKDFLHWESEYKKFFKKFIDYDFLNDSIDISPEVFIDISIGGRIRQIGESTLWFYPK
jgi:hypothetical protein